MTPRIGFLLLLNCLGAQAPAAESRRPNVLWFVVDDMSANFSCYGEKTIQTPHVDRLAEEGVRFTRAYATSPVCSAFRSALITGMYQTTIGAHHHRSGRGKHRIELPEGVQPIPALFQKAGYHTCIGSGLPDLDFRSMPLKDASRKRLGKTDYNFDWDQAIYDGADWAGRKEGQPFFMQVQLHGGKLRGASASGYESFDRQVTETFDKVTPPDEVVLPPYYPRDEVLLKDWSAYLDPVQVSPAPGHGVGVMKLGQAPSRRHPRTPFARRLDVIRQTAPRVALQSAPALDEARPHRIEVHVGN